MERSRAVITSIEECPRESWADLLRGEVSWYTLFSSDRTPTERMSAGIAELPPGGGGRQPHRHEQPELYYIIEGTGVLTIDGQQSRVGPGTAVFIPGDAAHCLRNDAATTLRLFYVFPTGSFADVVYRFPEAPEPGTAASCGGSDASSGRLPEI